MDNRKIILTGFAVTALLGSMVLSGIFPWQAALALVIIAGGIFFIGYVLFYRRQQERIRELAQLLKFNEEIRWEKEERIILDRLAVRARSLTGAEFVGVCFSGHAPEDCVWVEGQAGLKVRDLEVISREAGESRKTVAFQNRDRNDFPQTELDPGVKSVMAFPLILQEGVAFTMVAVQSLAREPFNPLQREIFELLIKQAVPVLENQREGARKLQKAEALLRGLMVGIEAGTPVFFGHGDRVAAVAGLIGRELRLDPGELEDLYYAAWLHDAGKILLPEPDEGEARDEVSASAGQDHCTLGGYMFGGSELTQDIAIAVMSHHERYNGQGYPRGLSHNQIPFPGRIIAVADFYDALTALCPEEERFDHRQAVQVIKKGTGTLFDPLVVVAFEEIEGQIPFLLQDIRPYGEVSPGAEANNYPRDF